MWLDPRRADSTTAHTRRRNVGRYGSGRTRQRNDERRSKSRRSSELDITAVCLRNPTCQRQPKPGAAVTHTIVGTRRVDTIEALKNPRLRLCRNPRPLIADRDGIHIACAIERSPGDAYFSSAQIEALLRGHFVDSPEDDDDVERKATLMGSGTTAKTTGEAEIEVSRTNNRLDQEVEVSVSNLTPSETYTVFVDAKQVGTFQTNKNGKAEMELTTASVK
jgi:hypothetical protein